jgi:SAM-dependent methyltransferase
MTGSTDQTNPLPPLAIRAWLRYDVVNRSITKLSPKTALEIGCGQGSFGARLAERTNYLGVEPDPASFEVACARIEPRGGTVLLGIHQVVPAATTYDLVCAFEVLEHIEDDKGALAEWVPFVRPGGHLVLSVPAFQERFGPMDRHAGHFRRYSPQQLEERLVEAGLTDVEIIVYGWPLGYALEAVRNRIDAKKLATAGDASIEELTAASGRTFQPTSRRMGAFVDAATLPFRYLQRIRPESGTGLVAIARRPDQSPELDQ